MGRGELEEEGGRVAKAILVAVLPRCLEEGTKDYTLAFLISGVVIDAGADVVRRKGFAELARRLGIGFGGENVSADEEYGWGIPFQDGFFEGTEGEAR